MIATWVRAVVLAASLLGCHRAILQAQRPPHELRGWAGLGCFVDESWCDVPHAVVGFGPQLYFSRSWSFAPEFLYARGSWDYDLILLPSLAVNLRSRGAVRPYAIFGFGLLRHHARNVSGTGWTLQGGLGVKMFVNPKVYVAPEIRLGWEPFLRVGAGVGYVFGK
ncbi:MAG TPA: hypothetical protein VNJ11_05595 [Bryobacteraceae bacterium]|nr:hypothetical protein [Bryobacteraceae bacterium]